MTGAVLASHRNGCNPGGEVAGWDFPAHLGAPHPRWCNRLLSRSEAEQMSLDWTGERLVSMREHEVEAPQVVEAEMNEGS